MGEQADLDLDADIAEVHREVQKVVDAEIAARDALAVAIANRVAVREKVAAISAKAAAFIDNYVSPVVPNPAPLAPEVAAPAPAIEPPVFTTVESAALSPETTSGGRAPVIDDLLDVPEAPAPVETSSEGEGAGESGGADTSTEE